RAGGCAHPGRPGADPPLPLRQPRRGGLHGPGHLRHHAQPQPARGLRLRRPLLPGQPAGAPGAQGHGGARAGPPARPAPRRGPGVTAAPAGQLHLGDRADAGGVHAQCARGGRSRLMVEQSAGPAGIDGWSILVTGGGSGIGLATAERLAVDGAHVTICGRTEHKLADATARIAEAAARGATARYVVADVTVEEQVAAAVAATTDATGRIDGLFACAGGSLHLGSVLTADVDAVRATIDLNLTGSVICVKQGAAAMQAHGGPGSIVLMSSGA